MMQKITGEFEVKLVPQTEVGITDSSLGRMSINKSFYGDLEAKSVGQMLSAGTEVKGSAGYVAIEKVTGKLSGLEGSFILQHNATMNKGVPSLNIIVVPDSGTGQLQGLSGNMGIRIREGKHFYDFNYSLKQ